MGGRQMNTPEQKQKLKEEIFNLRAEVFTYKNFCIKLEKENSSMREDIKQMLVLLSANIKRGTRGEELLEEWISKWGNETMIYKNDYGNRFCSECHSSQDFPNLTKDGKCRYCKELKEKRE